MAKTPQFKEAKHIEWTTPLPEDVPVKSSKFNLRDCECILTLSIQSTRNFFGESKVCVLHIFCKRKFTFPINVTVYIVLNNNTPTEASRTDVTGSEIWRCSMSKIKKYVNNSHLTLGITLQFQGKDSDTSLEKLSKDFESLLMDGTISDAKIKCEDMVWNVHKSVLSVRSKTLFQLIANDRQGILKVEDLEKQTVDVFIKYIYTGKLTTLTLTAAKQLYATSEKYAPTHLKEKCAEFLMENLIPEIACEILALANVHLDADLKKNVIDYISENKIPLMDDIWSDFCSKHPDLANEVLNHVYKLRNDA